MRKLSDCVSEFMDSLSPDHRKIAQAAYNNQKYKNAILGIWKSQEAARLILEKTNAFYVRRDTTKRIKKSYKENPHKTGTSSGDVVCEICLEDSMVLSELDTHREILAFALRSNGLTFDELKLVHSKGPMRERHPFMEDINL